MAADLRAQHCRCVFVDVHVRSGVQDPVDALAGGTELTQVNPAIVQGVAHASRVQTGGMGGAFVGRRCCATGSQSPGLRH